MEVKPAERPAVKRYVIRNAEKFYYTGHGHQGYRDGGGGEYEPQGEAGVPAFETRNILFAIKYGDTQSIDGMVKQFRAWCILNDRQDLFGLFDTCEIVETYT